MTLVPFPPEALDELALRFFDLAAITRQMAASSRENELADFALHANKVNEWLSKMEAWAHDASRRLETAVIRERGVRKAQSLTAANGEKGKGRTGRNRRKSAAK
ncbi:MAG TPA: hypothetical protein VHV55_08610 [Pirellulales bacterium]|jgi:hypothetical protein|nr:hypothetical protein [Pirellulales bacterium]